MVNPVLSLENPTLDQLREALVKVSAESGDTQVIENIWYPVLKKLFPELLSCFEDCRVFDSDSTSAHPQDVPVFVFREEGFWTKTPTDLGNKFEEVFGRKAEQDLWAVM